MAVVEVTDKPVLEGFVDREVHEQEIKETYLNRSDGLYLRIYFSNNDNVQYFFSKNRSDNLKTYSITKDAASEKHEIEFYKLTGGGRRVLKYTFEKGTVKGMPQVRYGCYYDPEEPSESGEGKPDATTYRGLALRQGASFEPETGTLSEFRAKIGLVTEQLQASSGQPYTSFEHDHGLGVVKVWLWPLGTFATTCTGDTDIDVHNLAVHTFARKGEQTTVEKDPSNPSKEDLADEYEWTLRRQLYTVQEILRLERWRFIFNKGMTHDKQGDCRKPCLEYTTCLEDMVLQLFEFVDVCDLKAIKNEGKGSAYDSLEAMLTTKVAALEQKLRDKDRDISALKSQLAAEAAQ